MQFEFLGFFKFKRSKMATFSIPTTIFEFKLKTWTNQVTTHHYRPPAPVAVGTNPTGSNGVGTARSEQPVAVKSAGASMSAGEGGTDRALVHMSRWEREDWFQWWAALSLPLDHVTSAFSLPLDHQCSSSSLHQPTTSGPQPHQYQLH
jgi:hypothetical protein